MKTAVIVDAVRTPIGRAHAERGVYRHVRGDELAATCVAALLERTGLPPSEVEDVIFGAAQQWGEQGLNVARQIGLLAGLPPHAAATTVNRLCGSSLQALHQATHAIAANAEDVHVVGGVEHMHHLPMGQGTDVHPRLWQVTSRAALHMGLTAEHLARREGVSREDQDQFALRSHQRAAAAQALGAFGRELVRVQGHDEAGQRTVITRDQCVRADTNLTALAALRPVFLAEGGSITAGNSSPVNDGAAALLVMSEEKARALGLAPLARVRATAVVGVEPSLMGTGPIPATEVALRRAGLTIADIDLVELNEAFAAQALVCERKLGLDPSRVNVRGGAIALGHPLGASGARLMTTLVHLLVERDAEFGLATMCVGMGQGVTTVVQRCG